MNDLEKSEKFKKDIVTKVEDYTTFFRAEEYHQNYAQKKSFRYKVYKK
jgi:peptide methionine sulfoxide reductase msrA/msrB